MKVQGIFGTMIRRFFEPRIHAKREVNELNITVYCGASSGSDPEFKRRAEELGRWMASKDHRLIYGGGNQGMMGAVSSACLAAGGSATGVSPGFFIANEETRSDLDELIVADDMAHRRNVMMELGDAFIALPGGTGTLDEITEVMAMKRLGRLGTVTKPVMFYNINGYYDRIFEFLDAMSEEKFCRQEDRDNAIEVRCIEDIELALEGAGSHDSTRNTLYDGLQND